MCTLGPASESPEVVEGLIRAGMDCARLNFSHGDHAYHRRLFETVRRVSEACGKPVAILQDLQGPKIRVGRLPGGQVELPAGERVVLLAGAIEDDRGRIPVDYAGLADDLAPGHPIRLDDGLLGLEVERIDGREIHARVIDGGLLRDRKGLNLPGSAVSLPSLTEKDRGDLELGLELGVDYVALSFVRTPADLGPVRAILGDPNEGAPPLIAKIERPQAVEHLDAILDRAEGIMVARGDLGVEVPLERVPIIQKRAIDLTNARGKLVITATQMLDSMTHAPRPTRAEVSDVANSVFDGTDAVMLSGETASGAHPVEAVRMMARIIEEVEGSDRYRESRGRPFLSGLQTFQNAAARAAVEAAGDLGIDTIVAFTETGRTAELIAEYRPEARILAFSPEPRTVRRMALIWGVDPRSCRRFHSTDAMFGAVEEHLLRHGLARRGDPLILVAGVPPNQRQSTNLVKLHRIA